MKVSKVCPGCGRRGSVCWIMPCLYLEIVLQRGRTAVKRWAKAVGAQL